MLRWRGLRRADRIGGREAIDQTGFQFRMGFPVGLGGLAWIGGVLVMRRGVGFFSHEAPPLPRSRPGYPAVPSVALANPAPAVYQEPERLPPVSNGISIDPELRQTLA